MAKREPVVSDTKQRILDAALDVFGERGYGGASVDEVAAAAGVTKGAVYYWFEDKEDLARDLQHLLWQRLAETALGAYDAQQPAMDNLRVCFETFLEAVREVPAARGFLREAWFSPELDAAGRADHEAWLEVVRTLLQEGISRGELIVVDVEAAARVLTGALMEATLHVLGSGDIASTLDVIGHILEAFAAASVPSK